MKKSVSFKLHKNIKIESNEKNINMNYMKKREI